MQIVGKRSGRTVKSRKGGKVQEEESGHGQ